MKSIFRQNEHGKTARFTIIQQSLSNLLISIDEDYAYVSAKLVDVVMNFDINELFILGADIKKIMEFKGKRIPCRINEFEDEFNMRTFVHPARQQFYELLANLVYGDQATFRSDAS